MQRFYVGRKRCGCVVAACRYMPDDPEAVSESVMEYLADGYRVELIHTDESPYDECTHFDNPAQQELFASAS